MIKIWRVSDSFFWSVYTFEKWRLIALKKGSFASKQFRIRYIHFSFYCTISTQSMRLAHKLTSTSFLNSFTFRSIFFISFILPSANESFLISFAQFPSIESYKNAQSHNLRKWRRKKIVKRTRKLVCIFKLLLRHVPYTHSIVPHLHRRILYWTGFAYFPPSFSRSRILRKKTVSKSAKQKHQWVKR